MAKLRGFSLIDLMIGLAIGLIGVLAVTKVMVSFTQQRNTISETTEAQGNGTMALYQIERDLGQAGYGMMNLSNCTHIDWYWSNPTCTTCGTQPALPILPVTIVDGGAASDLIRVQYGLTTSGNAATTIGANQAIWTDPYTVATAVGFDNTTDLFVTNVGGSCTMSQVTSVNKAALQVSHANTSSFNPGTVPPTGATTGWEAASSNTVLVNLGSFVSKAYSVSAANTLRVSAFPGFIASDLVDGIVFMKAQYGLDTNSDGIVDAWQGGSAIVSNMKQVLAIRVGIVAQSPLYEKNGIDAPTVLPVLPSGVGGVAAASVSYTIPNLDANGKSHFRYKTYYTIIPLRNVIWGI